MTSTHDDANTRDTKRLALTPPCGPTVASLDIAIWTTIIEFLPMPNDIEDESHTDATSEVLATWHTLLNLRLVSKELAALLHPVDNTILWRKLVLQGFDFSVGDRGGEDGEWWVRCLQDDVAKWSKLGIYHRSSQYGFLSALQQQPGDAKWPASEDAFSLFGDFVRLLQLPDGCEMETGGEGSEPVFKYLAAPAQPLSSYRSSVMETLGYPPQLWSRGRGIGETWKGFTRPAGIEASVRIYFDKKEDRDESGYDSSDDEDDESFDNSDDYAFPDCNMGDAMQLYRFIHQHFQDWRSVCCNEGSDAATAVFFVGKSKASPHRWIGYAGEKCWT